MCGFKVFLSPPLRPDSSKKKCLFFVKAKQKGREKKNDVIMFSIVEHARVATLIQPSFQNKNKKTPVDLGVAAFTFIKYHQKSLFYVFISGLAA